MKQFFHSESCCELRVLNLHKITPLGVSENRRGQEPSYATQLDTSFLHPATASKKYGRL